MPRKPMEDIVPKRSIRSVPVPASRASRTAAVAETTKEKVLKKDLETKISAEKQLEEDIELETEQVSMMEQERAQKEALRKAKAEFEETRQRRSRGLSMPEMRLNVNKTLLYSVGSVLAVVLLAIGVTAIFHSATVTVTPHTVTAAVDNDITAYKAPAAGQLAFQPIQFQETASDTVAATGEQQVSTRATGTITIYNNYSTTPQKLITNTRFQTPEGLIFRITASVTVPGMKGTTPGSVDATVLADAAGADYNVGLKDFTIPGFKGDPRYNGFYARSKTPLAGGFVGTQKIVSDSDRAKAKADIESKLHDALVKQVVAERTDSTVIYDGAYAVTFTPLPDQAVGTSNEVMIAEQGTITSAAFDRQQLSMALAKAVVPNYTGDAVTIPSAPELVFSTKDTVPGASDTFTFHISGNPTFQWVYDPVALKNALKGQSRSTTPTILQKFPMIEKADISIRPFWSSTFPSSVDKITVVQASN